MLRIFICGCFTPITVFLIRKPTSRMPHTRKSPQKISREVDRAAAPLRSVGIEITRAKRRITIVRLPVPPPHNSREHVTNVTHVSSPEKSNGYDMTCPGVGNESHVTHVEHVKDTSSEKPNGNRQLDVGDESDEGAGGSSADALDGSSTSHDSGTVGTMDFKEKTENSSEDAQADGASWEYDDDGDF